jgi:predicted AAA+ superfamily ATPase
MDRPLHVQRVRALLRSNPVVAILGARQVGKTTLARQIGAAGGAAVTRFDLESPIDRARLADPMLALAGLKGLVILDEVQHAPELFRVLRVLADRPRRPARFIVLGSASPELLRQSSESLAGRVAHYELSGFTLEELARSKWDRLWLRGGFPRSYLARTEAESVRWRDDFIATFLGRDLPQLGIRVAAATLERFWAMLAHYHGQTWNSSELGRAFGVSDTTVRHYLDILTSTYVVRQLPPWHENLAKRQVKAPKVYLCDSGLLHSLLRLPNIDSLLRHPKIGASWEGFALAQVEARLGVRRGESHFWGTHGGAELDLLVARGRQRLGFEFKRTSAPTVTVSMRTAMADLSLDRLDVVHAGDRTWDMAPRMRAVALSRLLEDVHPLK